MRNTLLTLLLALTLTPSTRAADVPKPNVIFILADDMGVGDAGCYGQTKIKTPNIDRIAAEGMKFTSGYCGTSVCAPSRCTLMTGRHVGHNPIRANREIKPEGQFPLPEGTFTVGHLFQQAGYKTACIGKWGLGFPGSSGTPEKMGFDYFFGYNCQAKAHDYYPEYLWRNTEKVMLNGKQYSHDLMAADALKWLRDNGNKPFFLYVPFTIPHAKFEVPELGAYEKETWPEQMKKYAAMIARMDRDIGRILDTVKEMGIDENTLIFFTSDNGPNPPFNKFFASDGGYRGIKRTLYEGGLREPTVARWPGHVPAGAVSDEPWVFYDFLPTVAELIGVKIPDKVKPDGISILPALLGGKMPHRDFIYWELHEVWTQQALRMGDWKAVRVSPDMAVELYDLKTDPKEKHDLAKDKPDILKQMSDIMAAQHVEDPNWPTKNIPPARKKKLAEESQ